MSSTFRRESQLNAGGVIVTNLNDTHPASDNADRTDCSNQDIGLSSGPIHTPRRAPPTLSATKPKSQNAALGKANPANGAPLHLILNLGPSCFVKCLGCYNHFAGTAIHRATAASRGDVERFLARARVTGLEQVTFGGGDPLSRTDLPDLLAFASGQGYVINVDTVGTTLLEAAETIFYGRGRRNKIEVDVLRRYVRWLGLPIDGSTEAIAQRFRTGRPFLLREVMQTIRIAASSGIAVCVNSVISQQNIDDVDDMAALVVSSGAKKWQLFQFSPVGPLASRNKQRYIIDQSDFLRATAAPARLAEEAGLIVERKTRWQRSLLYFIVDDAGTAWMPGPLDDERTVLGSISDDIERVLVALVDRAEEYGHR